ncbi:hypothetical protein CspHIS471_0105620 [Cutaneotrichosporon sp. HIS471]|nr:hypothetical protein CspHIS471_0105620 [Cutaneotrichosporon sp. HIS471]
MNALSADATATSTPVQPGTPAMLAADTDDKFAPRSDSILSVSNTITDFQHLEIDKKTSDSDHGSIDGAEKGKDGPEVDQRTHKPNALSSLPPVKKSLLLLFFCTAMFIDVAGVSATFLMTAPIASDLKVSQGNFAWVLGTYSLAFASTLLFAGRLADLYPPNLVYTAGFSGLGIFYLIISFMKDQYAFFILRSISALLAVLTIPSSINMIVQMYPDPTEQAKKLTLFGMAGALANTMGLILAGVFLLASWRWYFRFIAIVVIPFSVLCWYIMPRTQAVAEDLPGTEKWKRMDLIGVLGLMAILVLFILSFTQVETNGWKSAIFIAPLVISICLLPAWLYWEHSLPQGFSLLPHDIWNYPNIFPLIIQASSIFMWFATYQLRLATYWQEVDHVSSILAAARLLPMGVVALIVGSLTQPFPWLILRPRYVQPVGSVLAFCGSMLLAFSNGGRGADYWKYVFTGEIIGTAGGMIVFIGTNTSIIQSFPLEFAGVGGSFAQVIYQIGGVVGIAVQQGLLDTGHGGVADWTGSQNGYFFTSAYILCTGLIFVLWYRQSKATIPTGVAPVA